MIDIKIKTLDGNNHPFSVDDEITVQQLKEKIFERLGVAIGLQRLIFCGRVLQDDNRLADYGVHGKVLHMVQRAPPRVEAQQAQRERDEATTSQPPMNNLTPTQIRRLMVLAASNHLVDMDEFVGGASLPTTAARLDSLRRLIAETRLAVDALQERGETPVNPNEDPLESTSNAASESVQTEMICPIHQRPIDHAGVPGSRPPGPGYRIIGDQDQNAAPSDLGHLVAELQEIEEEFAPYKENYIRILQEASDPTVVLTENELQDRQNRAEYCAEIFHAISHAYHTISDIGLLLSHSDSRLTSEALLRNPQIHAQINIVQGSPTSGAEHASTSGNGSRPPPSNAQEGQNNSAQAGTNTHPTNDLTVQPDPVSYEVEIETAVPMINLENVFMSGTNANQGGQNQTNQSPQLSQNAAQPRQDAQMGRQQVMIDIENLFRELGPEALGNVEVMMSVEEIRGQGNWPQANNGGVPNNNNSASAPLTPSGQRDHSHHHHLHQVQAGVLLGQSADLLHTIMASVARQGAAPGMEGAVFAPAQQASGQSPQQGQGQDQSQGQGVSQARPRTRFMDIPPNPIISIPMVQSQYLPSNQNAFPESSQAGNQSSASSRSTPQRRGGAQQTVTVHHLMFDQFLQCDSVHARRQLQRRRDEGLPACAPRTRHNSLTRIHNYVNALNERFSRHAITDETLMIAATLVLREVLSANVGRALGSDDLFALRHRLRLYVHRLVESYQEGSARLLIDRMIERYSDFLERIAEITPLRRNVDLVASIKAVLDQYLHEAILLLTGPSHESFCNNFRPMFSRILYAICGVISRCCVHGVDGLRRVYRTFIIECVKTLAEPVRDLVHGLAMENLDMTIARMERSTHYQQFVRLTDQPGRSGTDGIPTSSQMSGVPNPMDWQMTPPDNNSSENGIPHNEATDPQPIVIDSDSSSNSNSAIRRVQNDSPRRTPEQTEATEVTSDPITLRTQNGSVFIIEPTVPNSMEVVDGVLRQEISHPASGGQSIQAASAAIVPTDPVNGSASGRNEHVERVSQNRGRFRIDGDDIDMPGDFTDEDNSMDWRIPPDAEGSGSGTDVIVVDSQSSPELEAGALNNSPVHGVAPVHGVVQNDWPRCPAPGQAGESPTAPSDRVVDIDDGTVRRVEEEAPESCVSSDDEETNWHLSPEDEGSDAADRIEAGRPDSSSSSPASNNSSIRRLQNDPPRRPAPEPTEATARVTVSAPRRVPVVLLEAVDIGDARVRNDPPRRPAPEPTEATARVTVSAPRRVPVVLLEAVDIGDARVRTTPVSSSTTTESFDDGMLSVPPAQVSRPWGAEWAPAFARDGRRVVSSSADEPFSDAYLSGMPPSKRRCVRQARPPTNLDAFIAEGVREVAAPLAAVDDGWRAVFRDQLRRVARRRSARSANYEPTRFEATARFLDQARAPRTSWEQV